MCLGKEGERSKHKCFVSEGIQEGVGTCLGLYVADSELCFCTAHSYCKTLAFNKNSRRLFL